MNSNFLVSRFVGFEDHKSLQKRNKNCLRTLMLPFYSSCKSYDRLVISSFAQKEWDRCYKLPAKPCNLKLEPCSGNQTGFAADKWLVSSCECSVLVPLTPNSSRV